MFNKNKSAKENNDIYTFLYRDWYLKRYNLRDSPHVAIDFVRRWERYENYLRGNKLKEDKEVRNVWFDKDIKDNFDNFDFYPFIKKDEVKR